jgi:hypothetical protein
MTLKNRTGLYIVSIIIFLVYVLVLCLSFVSILPIRCRLFVCDYYLFTLGVVLLLLLIDFFNYRKLRFIYLFILIMSVFMILTIKYINPY